MLRMLSIGSIALVAFATVISACGDSNDQGSTGGGQGTGGMGTGGGGTGAGKPTGKYAGRIGIEADVEFVDMGRTLRPWEIPEGGKLAPVDEQGWPKSDARTVLFDHRPVPAWAPPIDDPEQYQPDMSGTYKLSFHGQAKIGVAEGNGFAIENQAYDAASNTTTADLVLAKDKPALVALTFTETKRTSSSGPNTGITDLKAIRPGYPADTKKVFTDRLLEAYNPFSHIRFMGVTNTNADTGFYGDPGHHLLDWSKRSLPSDSTQSGWPELREGKVGLAWEYVVLLANATHKDVWINVPVNAIGSDPKDTKSYVYQLATLLKKGNEATGNVGLDPSLNIYIEHSNEVWNFGFPQYIYNKMAAEEEAKGDTPIKDGSDDPEVWARRRHAKRLYEITQIFKEVFGADSIKKQIRPVYAAWTINPQDYYTDVLAWMKKTYGAPSDYFYAMAVTSYFNDDPVKADNAPKATVDDVLAAMRKDSENTREMVKQMRTIADQYAVKLLVYEGGPDNGGGSTVNIGPRILANRDKRMQSLLVEHVTQSWFDLGGDTFSQFGLTGLYSRYGCWGLTDDLANLKTPKYLAMIDLLYGDGTSSGTGSSTSSTNSGGTTKLSAPTGLMAVAGDQKVDLTWNAVSGAASYSVYFTTGGNFNLASADVKEAKYTQTGLVNGTAHQYYVVAVGADGSKSDPSSTVAATPGKAP